MLKIFKKLDCFDPIGIITPMVIMMVLIAVLLSQGYLFYHVLVELFTVIVGVTIAIIAYFMYKFTRNDFLLFLGIGFFWTALLDLFHMLSYYGMNIYAEELTQNPSTTLWICARLFEVSTIFLAPFIRFNTISPRSVFVLVGLVALGAYFGTFMGLFPQMYLPSEGLTTTKIVLEYGIIIASLITMIIYRSKQGEYHPFMYQMIRTSLLFGILAEGCFTLYVDVYGFMNFLGHIFKFLAYWMIFRGVVITALKEPFSLLSKASSAYDAIPVPVIVVDLDGIIRQTNRATTQCASGGALIGRDNHSLLHPPGVDPAECSVCQAISRGESSTFEVAFGNKYKQYTISPIKTEGMVTGTLQICIDMTAQRIAEHELMKEGTLLKTIINTVPVRLFWKDKNSVYLGCNNLFAQDAGLQDPVEIIGKRDSDFPWHEQAGLYCQDDKEVIQNAMVRINYEEPQQRGKEEENWVSTSKVPLREEADGAIIGVVGSYTDITDIRRTRLELKKSETFYRTVFASVHEAVCILSNDIIIDCNDEAMRLFEMSKQQLIGMNIFHVVGHIDCLDNSFDSYLNAAYQGESVTVECLLTFDNHNKEIKITEITLSGFGHDEKNRLVMVIRDITKRVEEEKFLRMQTRQAQMGEMISMIAHQWRQPLAIINAIASQMRLEAMISGNEGDTIDHLIKIEEQSSHLSYTISAYRDFFRPDKPKEHFTISTLVNNALSLIDHTLKNHGIKVQKVVKQESNLFTIP